MAERELPDLMMELFNVRESNNIEREVVNADTLKPFITQSGCIPVWATNRLWNSNRPIGESKPKPLKTKERNHSFFQERIIGNPFLERVVKVKRANEIHGGDRAPWKRAPDPVGGRYPTREELLHPEAVGA